MKKQDIKNNIINWANNIDNPQNTDMALLFTKSNTAHLPQIYLFSKFGIAQGAEIGLQSQITTHYTEENSAVNDHWAIAPMTYSVSGLIGELLYAAPTKWMNYIEAKTPKMLDALNFISPTLDNYTQAAYNITQQIEADVERYRQVLRQGLSSLGFIEEGIAKTNQEYVFSRLQELQYSRQLVQVETPYGSFSNMAITNIRLSQKNNRYISNLTVDFQQWRDVKAAATRAATASEKADMAKLQQALTENQGVASTQEVQRTGLKTIVDGVMGANTSSVNTSNATGVTGGW